MAEVTLGVIGAVPVVFELLDGAVKAYSFFMAVGRSDESYDEINDRLDMEQLRSLAFMDAAQLLDSGEARHLSEQQRLVIIAVLKQIDIKLESLTGLVEYAPKSSSPTSDSQNRNEENKYDEFSIVGKYSSFKDKWSPKARARAYIRGTNHIRKLWSIGGHVWHNPRSLKWALHAQSKYCAIVDELTKYTQYLEGTLQGEYLKRLLESQRRVELEIILVRDSVRDLQRTQESTNMVQLTMYSSQSRLKQLAQTKALNVALQDDAARPPPSYESATEGSKKISIDQIKNFELPNSASVTYRVRSGAQYFCNGPDGTRIDVWIEWKAMHFEFIETEDGVYEAAVASSIRRVEDIVSLLQESYSSARDMFRTPECLGYINLLDYRDSKGKRTPVQRVFGLVYRKPYKPVSSLPKAATKAAPDPVSLLELLTKHPIPSLSIRINLAQRIAHTMLYFHIVRWFHKALRSDAVVFHHNADGSIDYADPLVTGFDYSRPDLEQTQSTTDGSGNVQNLLYVHPAYQVQSGVEHHFLWSFDIYSLGIVLLEIAYWKPIKDILGEERQRYEMLVERPGGSFEKSVRAILWEDGEVGEGACYVSVLKEMVGERYYEAVRGCVEGFVEKEKEVDGQHRRGEAAKVKEHVRFMEVVIDGLGGVVV